ncbi:MAG: GH92 family glycosyl hydrolase [Chloracidobacterium sp.]|nr:GH92 family glycosyl hydrolase [Chloracidobacterium sp.]
MRATSNFSASLRLCGLVLALCISITAQRKDFTKWVNPFIGTGGHGHTFPGAVMPFGMVQLSPDTRTDNWDGSSGYHYSDDIIYGFSHTHLSGTGIPDGCDILFMPTVGEPQFFAKEGDKSINGYASKFSHANEKAEPGYYAVKLDDDGIFAEMTVTKRVGFHRYTFPETKQANINLDLKWRDKVIDSEYSFLAGPVSNSIRIEGHRRSTSWAKNQIVYFVADISKPFESVRHEGRAVTSAGDKGRLRVTPPKSSREVSFQFTTSENEQVLMKVAISFVSIEGARENLEAELPHWNFDKVRASAKAAWNKELSKIEVSGGTDAQTTTFYTALYHTMIHPSIFNDVDGKYRGLDGKIHNIADDALSTGFSRPAATKRPPKGETQKEKPPKGGTQNSSDQYTVFSLWDTFRAAHPLYTIIDQKRTVDFINSFIRIYEQGGRLPVWELWGEETDTMIGYHAVSVVADAMAKGIKGFDYEKAYAAAKHSAELDHFGLAAYKKRGYISQEDENESVSKTLEYAYNDWCILQMNRVLGQQYPHAANGKQRAMDWIEYSRRARSFENLFDPRVDYFVPRKNGGFIRPFAPNEVTFHFTEGNSWVYSFFVPHDTSRMMELMGGSDYFAGKLERLFATTEKLTGREQPDITGLIGQYAHGNEPSHHIPYLFSYAQMPWRTQAYVRKIMDEFYKPTPDGLIGNEDCGQMSAWYVLSASGFYPVVPGDGVYAFGTPLFPEMTYRLENGKMFSIKALNVSPKNKYILNAGLNSAPYKKAYIRHEDILKGGLLEFAMTDKPVTTAFTEFPASDISTSTVAAPWIDFAYKVFIGTTTPGAAVFFTTDGREPVDGAWTLYSQPFEYDRDANLTIKAVAVYKKGNRSKTVEAVFRKRPNGWTVKIDSKYNRQYTGGGDEGLIDGIRGSTNFASGEWQGYQAQDFVATIDLQRETEIKKVGGGFLQVARSWIWMPTRIVFEVSSDNVNFTRVADIKTDIDPKDMESKIRDYVQTISPVKARYVRVHAYNLGKIPAWHPGAGDDAFIFVDEIMIN